MLKSKRVMSIVAMETRFVIGDASRDYRKFVAAVVTHTFAEKFEPQYRYFQGVLEALYQMGAIEGTDAYWDYFENELFKEIAKGE